MASYTSFSINKKPTRRFTPKVRPRSDTAEKSAARPSKRNVTLDRENEEGLPRYEITEPRLSGHRKAYGVLPPSATVLSPTEVDAKIDAFYDAHPSLGQFFRPLSPVSDNDASADNLVTTVTDDLPITTHSAILAETSMAPQVRLVDGEIVLDNASLYVDQPIGLRHYSDYEVVEEQSNQLSAPKSGVMKLNRRRSSSSSTGSSGGSSGGRLARRKKKRRWTMQETRQFYRALRLHGPDFEKMATVVPTRTHKEVRAMFKREESLSPEKIIQAMAKRVAVAERNAATSRPSPQQDPQ
ncbi:hypothetical protein DM01DRAFT_324091 [Hesseltinella vesiculosa]|uniref:SANT domain-containing protein n=1 Tax=Hesseltinella vesiculosa TaxID=101127 RepID=A0A1X2GUV9_9FUNG|nr:hypothetical protein DM01DRAFT_324091 [Hesseltinella vesiculosa]